MTFLCASQWRSGSQARCRERRRDGARCLCGERPTRKMLQGHRVLLLFHRFRCSTDGGKDRSRYVPAMTRESTEHAKLDKIWSLIREAHTALLVTVGEDGALDSRPMGCVQREFDGTIWFLTFAGSSKLREVADNSQVLVSYARLTDYEYVSLSGRARVSKDRQKVGELWSEGFRVWFPSGPDDPDLALLSVEVEEAKYWTDAASVATCAWAYIKARVLGQRPKPEQIAEIGSVRL